MLGPWLLHSLEYRLGMRLHWGIQRQHLWHGSGLVLGKVIVLIMLGHVWLWHLVLLQLGHVWLLLWHLQSAVPVLLQ